MGDSLGEEEGSLAESVAERSKPWSEEEQNRTIRTA